MKIQKWRPLDEAPSPKGFQRIADYDLTLSDDVTLFKCFAVRAPDGKIKVYPPYSLGVPLAALSPTLRSRVISQALAEIDGETNNVSH